MPVIAVAPNNDLLEKLKSNLMEVRARGGELIVFADPEAGIAPSDGVTVILMPRHISYFQSPAVYTIPLQLLAYHVAILEGTVEVQRTPIRDALRAFVPRPSEDASYLTAGKRSVPSLRPELDINPIKAGFKSGSHRFSLKSYYSSPKFDSRPRSA